MGFSRDEAAVILNISPSTVDTHLLRAKEKLSAAENLVRFVRVDPDEFAEVHPDFFDEAVTRTLSERCGDMMGLDFPFVATVPLDEQRRRANQVVELATTENSVERIEHDVGLEDETVRGKYWRGMQLIDSVETLGL